MNGFELILLILLVQKVCAKISICINESLWKYPDVEQDKFEINKGSDISYLNENRKEHYGDISVGTFPYFPFSILTENGNELHAEGIEIRALKEVSTAKNASLKVHRIDDMWGEIFTNGSATGVYKELLSGKVDIGAGGFYVAYSESVHVDYSISHEIVYSTLVTKRPEQIPLYLTIILPFRPYLWACLFLTLFAFPLIILLMIRTYKIFEPNNVDSGLLYYKNSLFYSIAILLNQGLPSTKNMPFLRLLLNCFVIFSFLISVCYTSKIISYLTKPVYRPPIDNVEQMIESGLLWTSYDGYLANRICSWETTLAEELCSCFSYITDISEIEKLVLKKQYAMHMDKLTTGYIIGGNILSKETLHLIHTMKESILKLNTAIVLKKHSPLTTLVDKILFRCVESGVMSKWTRDLYDGSGYEKIGEKFTSSHHDVKLSICHLQGVFYLFFIGIGFGVIFFYFRNQLGSYFMLYHNTKNY